MTNDEDRSDVRKLRRSLNFQPLKFVHIFFCLLLTLYGVAIFLLTITVRTELSGYINFLEYYLDKPVIVLIVGSIILIGLGCLGVIATAQNIYQGIVTFGVLLFGLFMFILTMGAVVLATLNSADLSLTEALELSMNNYTENSDPMDYIQANLDCCGKGDFTDWNLTIGYIPGSCCDSDSACGFDDVLNLNEIGCYEALSSLIQCLMIYLALILAGLVILQIMAMTITFFFARGIADIRRKISDCSNEADEEARDSVTQMPQPIQNPLGVRRFVPLKGDYDEDTARSTTTPYPVKIFGPTTLPGQASAPIRTESFLRQQAYNDVPFSYTHNPPCRTVTPTAPPMPVSNRRFPAGF